jgi:hypothetical protein
VIKKLYKKKGKKNVFQKSVKAENSAAFDKRSHLDPYHLVRDLFVLLPTEQ